MDLYNLVVSAKLSKGEGGDVDIDALTVTENGVYSASSGHAYSPVTVSVPQSGITPTGTKDINANGIYDVTDFASASVSVSGIVPSGTSSITANGIYDITNFASVDVNVSGGGGGDHDAEDGIIQKTISGAYTNSRVTKVASYVFMSNYSLTAIDFPNVISVNESAFYGCSNVASANFPKLNVVGQYAFYGCRKLKTISLPMASSIGGNAFNNCYSLYSVILLSTSLVTLQNSNAFNYTPLAYSSYYGTFGSIYVPASLVDSYKVALRWSYYSDRITSYVE